MLAKKLLSFFCSGLLLLTCFSFDSRQEQEYSIKAAFLYRFLDYISWDKADDPDVFTIAVAGDSEIIAPLTEISKTSKIRDKKLVIRQYQGINDLAPCQILFISKNSKIPVESILAKMDGKPVVIISEQEDCFEKGSHINFMINDSKLKFEVNLRSAARSGIRISSQLLQHALLIKR